MTPEDAYELAKYQRPGVKLVVGDDMAEETKVKELPMLKLHDLPGHYSWFEYDMCKIAGEALSSWALGAAHLAVCAGKAVAKNDLIWLNKKTTSKDAAINWICKKDTSPAS